MDPGSGWHPQFDLASFAPGAMTSHARADACIDLVRALVRINRLWLEGHPDTPSLFRAGVRFLMEPPGAVNWMRDIPATIAAGGGHCVALSCWRIAELQEAGEDARVCVDEWQPTPGAIDFHVQVLRANGDVEDVARMLGMP